MVANWGRAPSSLTGFFTLPLGNLPKRENKTNSSLRDAANLESDRKRKRNDPPFPFPFPFPFPSWAEGPLQRPVEG